MQPEENPYTFTDTVWIAATPQQVYDTVSDVTRTGEWSVFTRACEWEDADGPVVGAHFVGHNTRPGRDWDTRSTVTVADPGRAFAWEVNDGWVRWSYTMTPEAGAAGDGARGTRLAESWEFTELGRENIAGRYPDDGDAQIAVRVEDARTSIPTTLAAIKEVVEGSSRR